MTIQKQIGGCDEISCKCGITGKLPAKWKHAYCKHCGRRYVNMGGFWLITGQKPKVLDRKHKIQLEAVDRFICTTEGCTNSWPVGPHSIKKECFQCHSVYEKVNGKWLKREIPGMTFGDLKLVQFGNKKVFCI